jgi:hypothetical protein
MHFAFPYDHDDLCWVIRCACVMGISLTRSGDVGRRWLACEFDNLVDQ